MFGILRRKVGFGGSHASILRPSMERLQHGIIYGMSRNYAAAAKQMTVRDALNSALDEELTADPNVLVMGEEVGEYQGAYKITKGLLEKYGPMRILDTPITEAGFTGIGVGAAYYGLRPVVEFMTFNFALQGIDHIINSAAKTYYMSSGRYLCLLFSEGLMVPLLELVPNTPRYFAILTWHLTGCTRYGQSFPVSAEALDSSFCLPIGKAKIEREGEHVTITAFSNMVGYALQAAEILSKERISAEVINLLSIRPLDRTTINASVRKTNRLVTVEEGFPQHGVGAEICTSIMEESFEYLDAPVERIAGADIPMPYAANLERIALPQVDDIVRAAKRACYRLAAAS